jgi:hypothetical protein
VPAQQQPASWVDYISPALSSAWEKFATLIAAGGLTLPIWHTNLADVSQTAALWVPILSALFLLIQLGLKIWQVWRHIRH